MSLKEKDLARKTLLESQIKSVNLDMSILQGLSKQSEPLNQLPKPVKLSLNELSQVLKNKNEKFTTLKSEKQEAKEWLRDKGVDMRKINREVAENVKVSTDFAVFVEPLRQDLRQLGVSSMGRRESVIGNLPQTQKQYGFTADLQFEFLTKQKQVAMCRGIMKSMKGSKPHNTNAFHNVLINRIKSSRPNDQTSVNKSFNYDKPLITLSRDDRQQAENNARNQYFDFVQSLATQGFGESLSMLKGIKPFWGIVLKHLETVQHYGPQLEGLGEEENGVDVAQCQLNSFVMIKSLRMIEHEFSKSLPDTTNSYQKLDDEIRSWEKRNRKLRVWRNSHGQPTWALVYMFFRAGRMDEVRRLLGRFDREFLEELIAHEESLKNMPQKSLRKHDQNKYKDTFYTQLVYILQATPKFDPEIIREQNLTKLWIILRTVGIYRHNAQIENTYQTLQDSVIRPQTESTSPLTEQKVESFLYLGIYRKFVYLFEMQLQNTIQKEQGEFNEDDYFHILTVLNYYPELWGSTTKRQRIGLEAKYASALLKYMKRLRSEGCKREIARYLMLCPISRMDQVACEFITNRQQYKEFDWQSLKILLRHRNPEQATTIYINLSKTVLDSLNLTTFDDFVFASELYQTTFRQFDDSSYLEQKLYAKLLVKHLYFVEKKKFLLLKHQSISEDFRQEMFRFFQVGQAQKEEARLGQRDGDVKRRVQECEAMLEGRIEWNNTSQEYVRNVISPFLFYNKVKELSQSLENPYDEIASLRMFEPQWYKSLGSKVSSIDQTQNLLQFFRSEFEKQIVALYVFYLVLLVQRKRILSTKQCDYSGLTGYITGMMKELDSLENAYKQRVNQALKDNRKNPYSNEQERNRIVEDNTNPLLECEQYRSFWDELNTYMAEFGGQYQLELKDVNRSMPQGQRGSSSNLPNHGSRMAFGEEQYSY